MEGAVLSKRSVDQEEMPSVQAEAQVVLDRLQRALQAVMVRIPGGIKRPMDLQHALGQDYKVCWQVFQFVQAENPLAASQHVPSMVLMRKFIATAAERGVPVDIAERAERAMEEFQELVSAHADDRAAFDAILATISGGGAAESVGIQHRRKAFRSESLLWGVQTGVVMSQQYVRMSKTAGWYDECYTTLKHELKRLRPNVMPILHGYRPHTNQAPAHPDRVALDPASMNEYGAPLLSRFCSQPPPRLLSVPATDGWHYSVLDSRELGRKGSATVVFGGITRSPVGPDEFGATGTALNLQVTMPTELAVVELFVHKPLLGEKAPTFEACMMSPGMGPGVNRLPEVLRRARRLELHAEVERLGAGAEVVPLTKVPRYSEMTAWVFERLGWDAGEFEGFRVQVPFPVLHSEMEIRAGQG